MTPHSFSSKQYHDHLIMKLLCFSLSSVYESNLWLTQEHLNSKLMLFHSRSLSKETKGILHVLQRITTLTSWEVAQFTQKSKTHTWFFGIIWKIEHVELFPRETCKTTNKQARNQVSGESAHVAFYQHVPQKTYQKLWIKGHASRLRVL